MPYSIIYLLELPHILFSINPSFYFLLSYSATERPRLKLLPRSVKDAPASTGSQVDSRGIFGGAKVSNNARVGFWFAFRVDLLLFHVVVEIMNNH